MRHAIQMNTTTKHYAPYVYLSRLKDQDVYDLYLLVPVANHECLEFLEPEEFNDEIVIHAEVVKGDDEVIEVEQGRFVSRHFRFCHETDEIQFDPEEFKVVILINDETECLATATIEYEDCDTVSFERGFEGGLAMNCPYTYLHCPSNTNFNPMEYHYPKVLIPMEGYKFLGPAEELTITSTNNGVCEDIILLARSEGAPFQIIAPGKINSTKFRDGTKKEIGNLSVLTLLFDDEDDAWEFIEKSYEERHEVILFKEMIEDTEKMKSEIKIRTKNADTLPVYANVSNQN